MAGVPQIPRRALAFPCGKPTGAGRNPPGCGKGYPGGQKVRARAATSSLKASISRMLRLSADQHS